jgi:energy-converting hydrogenase Eha subunit A
MKPWTVIAGWAALLALWTVVQLAFLPPWLTVALLGGASCAVLILAAVVTRERRPRRSPELSFATPLLALGVAALVSGAELGTWCLLLGALITACGLATLVSEVRR